MGQLSDKVESLLNLFGVYCNNLTLVSGLAAKLS